MESDITKELFEVKGKPLVIPPRFQNLWRTIFKRDRNRVNVIAPTQDGKTLTIASAVTVVAAAMPERFAILAPSDKKADIMMAYVREFATQNPIIYSQLELDKNDTLDRLRRERAKRHLTFKRGGGVQTLTLDARNSRRSIEAALGFGCVQKGCKVLTDKGNIEISELVKKKKATKVYSYNHKKNKVELKKIIEYQQNPLANRELIEIDLGDRKIVCTEDHPVWVKDKGYIKASLLNKEDKLWVID